jgi:hypothetical protein
MTDAPARFALSLVFMACVGGTGCAGPGLVDPSTAGLGSVGTPTGPPLAPQAGMETIVIGKSSKADVSATLGRAIVIAFDSGYEVWVYRWAGSERTTRAATELVLLFEPSGLVAKVRVRPGYQPVE